jgi:hypothetical protein
MNGVIAGTGMWPRSLRSGDIMRAGKGSAKSLASESASRNEVVKTKSFRGVRAERFHHPRWRNHSLGGIAAYSFVSFFRSVFSISSRIRGVIHALFHRTALWIMAFS